MPTQTVDPITLFGQSPKQLFQREDFRTRGYTLLEEINAYQTNPAFRQSVHDNLSNGIWTPEIVLTDGAEQLPNGYLALRWIRRPTKFRYVNAGSVEDMLTGKEEKAERILETEGEELIYKCPESGFRVPADGLLFDPQTGAAIATVEDRSKAAEQAKAYIEKHPDQFKGWTIPERTVQLWKQNIGDKEFENRFGKNFNPKNPTPEQLALVETSYQRSPSANSGVRAVSRVFWRHGSGPLHVDLGADLSDQGGGVGARLAK